MVAGPPRVPVVRFVGVVIKREVGVLLLPSPRCCSFKYFPYQPKVMAATDAYRGVVVGCWLLFSLSDDMEIDTICTLLGGGDLLHAVQGTAGLEPFDLLLVERMVQLDLIDLAVGFDLAVQLLAGGELVQA